MGEAQSKRPCTRNAFTSKYADCVIALHQLRDVEDISPFHSPHYLAMLKWGPEVHFRILL